MATNFLSDDKMTNNRSFIIFLRGEHAKYLDIYSFPRPRRFFFIRQMKSPLKIHNFK